MDTIEVWFWIWAFASAFLFVAEIFTAGFFMLPFGIGAAGSAMLAYFKVPIAWQWGCFILVSIVSFRLLRRFADKLTHEPPVKTGSDRLFGKTGIVIEELTPNSPLGQARIEREEWRAEAPGHGTVAVGTRVVVEGVEGTHLIVRPE